MAKTPPEPKPAPRPPQVPPSPPPSPVSPPKQAEPAQAGTAQATPSQASGATMATGKLTRYLVKLAHEPAKEVTATSAEDAAAQYLDLLAIRDTPYPVEVTPLE